MSQGFKNSRGVMDHNQQRETNKESECLLEQALDGDREALDKLLAGYRLRVYRQALRIVGNAEDAEDVVQDAFFKAACHLHQFERRSKFSTWLTRVVINTALMFRRSNRAHRQASLVDWLSTDEGRVPLEVADLQPDPEQACAASEIGALVNEQFNLLSPALRSAFQLRHIDGLSCVEAGQSLGISVSALKSRVGRAKQQLAKSLNHAHRGFVKQTLYGVVAAGLEVSPQTESSTYLEEPRTAIPSADSSGWEWVQGDALLG
jgi:RNA polymerase sigma-70 factor, ECF subfamily